MKNKVKELKTTVSLRGLRQKKRRNSKLFSVSTKGNTAKYAQTNTTLQLKPGIWVRLRQQKFLFFLLIPGILYFTLFHYVPMYGIQLAFKKWIPPLGIFGSPWIGLATFKKMFSLSFSLQVIRNTFEISVLQIIFGFPAPIILALLLNELRFVKFRKTIQTISYLPHFLSWAVVSGLVIEMLSPNRGIYGYLAELLNFQPIILIQSKTYFRSILITSGIWKTVGWGSVIYLATMAGIDPALYEASSIDGANRFQNILHITLPCLRPVIVILLIFQLSGLLQVSFDPVFNLYNPAVFEVAEVLSTYTYRVAFGNQSDYALSTAIGLANNVIAFILLILANKGAKWISSEYGIW